MSFSFWAILLFAAADFSSVAAGEVFYTPVSAVISNQNELNEMERALLTDQLSKLNHKTFNLFLNTFDLPRTSLPATVEYWMSKNPTGLAIYSDFFDGLIPSKARLPEIINPQAISSLWSSRIERHGRVRTGRIRNTTIHELQRSDALTRIESKGARSLSASRPLNFTRVGPI
eukprot:CAMPEP_0184687532 /NCGR_PEP_ID=MMETSP0312-20130426/26757_1 /TAXON_ID=31354 /ORGANISM="Compsopogon coeruleus, Strain SAG 36.94" /LENGTH=172 /DNA_ID=CAMNT_0027143785 /DNA_START=206 /DNA_END=721 /DNA_ORIENTATION=+